MTKAQNQWKIKINQQCNQINNTGEAKAPSETLLTGFIFAARTQCNWVWWMKGSSLCDPSLSLPQILYERCDRLRPTLYRLASDTMDDDTALTQILAANDELTLVLNTYKKQVGKKERNGGREKSQSEDRIEDEKNGRFFLC